MVDTPYRPGRPFIILPTYNERENLEAMIPALFALPVENLRVLVVDDSSPDGTGDFVRLLQKNEPRLFLLSRPKKEGLGRAYVAGFLRAMELGADALVQMDADFSHNPADVVRLLQGLEGGDLVIGSRYIRGGGTRKWSFSRWLLSRSANLYARWVIGCPFRDLTGGFKAWRAETLKGIQLDCIQTNGYGFQIETTFRAHRKSFKIKELPIVFEERRSGKSKMHSRIVFEALGMVWRLRKSVCP